MVRHIQTAVNVSESDGMVQMTVAISMPPGAGPIETSFKLLANTLDGTAIAAGLPLLNLYVILHCAIVLGGSKAPVCQFMPNGTAH